MFAKLFNIERNNRTLQALVKIDTECDKPKVVIEFETGLECYNIFKLTFGPFPNTEVGYEDAEQVFRDAKQTSISCIVNETIDFLTPDEEVTAAISRALELS